MKVIGITGGIGSGKTTVCKIFECFDIPVYYADDSAKWLMQNDSSLIRSIRNLFGKEAYDINSRLNRKFIAAIVFNNPEKLSALNDLVHPAVAVDFKHWLTTKKEHPYVLKEAALLVETGNHKTLDALIVVTAPEKIRIERVMQRDNISKEEVLARVRNQIPQQEKDALADYLIVNDGEQHLINQVRKIHLEIIAQNKFPQSKS